MADVYELNTIADLLKIPVKSLDACLRDLRYALELCHFAGGEDTSTMAFDSFAWTDDGRHDIDMSMNGSPFLKLNVTDEAALSHAAGQEVEYPEAAEVCAEAYQVVGCLLDDLGIFDTPEAEKILDNLSQHRLVHRDVLPWTTPAVARSEGEG